METKAEKHEIQNNRNELELGTIENEGKKSFQIHFHYLIYFNSNKNTRNKA